MLTARTSISLLIAAALFALPLAASAHVLKTSGTMGIVLHLDPEDEPQAGVVTPIYLAFKDTAGRFKFSECDCRMYIAPYAQKDSIDTSKASDAFLHTHGGDELNADATFVFPKPDVYALEVVGTPKDGSSFTPFTVLYDVRVATYGSNAISPVASFFKGHALHFVIFGGGFLFFLAAVLYDRRKAKPISQ
ncbi:MAG: hypothetical protein JO019_02440 [Candidatus Kaiserbacteria bacterium]|nr:hypothetical protein [Candidatus Kaiserbacteria bacterium]